MCNEVRFGRLLWFVVKVVPNVLVADVDVLWNKVSIFSAYVTVVLKGVWLA